MIKGYEERYLLILLSAVMNQKPSPEPIRLIDWEKMFRLADYHGVAHAVHYGILGLDQEVPQAVRRQFFDKYLESVYRVERLQKSEMQIVALMEHEKINSFYLSYSDIVKNYPVEEMCCRDSIEIGSSKKSTRLIWEILKKVDFENRKTDEMGTVYYRIPGIRILNFDHTLFFSASMRRFFKNLLKLSPVGNENKHIGELPLDERYLFYMCRLTDSYARGNISLSQIMDFWIFYKTYAESFHWPYIYGRLKKLKIADFAERLEHLILRWFGTGAVIENVEIYEAMESYILSKGTEGREVSSKLLPLIKSVADCYARNRRLEEVKKMISWLFPDRRYMETIYPFLGRAGILLPLFWVLRLWRYLSRLCMNHIRNKVNPKLKCLFKKNRKTINDSIEEESKETAEIPK
ncbi:nucleotidyltransferase family protein [Lacrimispora sp.]|uniref:nucleotidyltransferase family protein n=1 Tax=Lacrimispora sp. TaxID=2719234 RepID=UPI0029E35122|nr:hypothetical protein [Lacrimispora sp.]